ncbi:MAG: PEP-CTERM sorting domain-containing protein [Planctomycetota bacterium]|jgi:hypothetical protein
MNMKRKAILVMAVFAVLSVESASHADLVGYLGENQTIYHMNFTTGEGHLVGWTNVSPSRALEISPLDGRLYSTSDNGRLYEIDTVTGEGSWGLIIDTGQLGYNRLRNLAFAPSGDLYVISYDPTSLVCVNLETEHIDRIGGFSWPYEQVTAFAIDELGRAIAWDAGSQWLFEINLSDGSATPLGHLPGNFSDFDYGPDNLLYANDDGNIYVLDVDTQQLTSYLGHFWPPGPFTLVPEPTTLLLLGFGGFALLRRKR